MALDVLVATLRNPRPDLLIKTLGITGSSVIVNQGGGHELLTILSDEPSQRVLETPDLGLSRSRNRALEASTADICLLADDDERLHPYYETRCERAFEEFPNAGIIGFSVPHWDRVRNMMPSRSSVGPLEAMRLTSVQLAIRREVILGKGVAFDERFGAGAGYESGEEYIFLRDAMRAGVEIRAVPLEIAFLDVSQEQSTWSRQMNDGYLKTRGAIFRRADPRWHSALALQWSVRKRSQHRLSALAAYAKLRQGSRAFARGRHE
jgi:glycosyltransferase involved in cell wall biosynthesis